MPIALTADSAVVGSELQRSAHQYYPSVQGLRGASALSVMCLHLCLMARHGGFLPPLLETGERIWSSLGAGVGLFFIISGFVIPASLVRHGDLGRFFVDRLLRIMPVFVAIHLLVFVVGPFIGYKWLRDIGAARYAELFLSNLTFTALPLDLPLAQQNSWTLTYEWAFYLFVGAAWVLVGSGRRRALGLIAVGVAAAAICLWFQDGLLFLTGMAFTRFRPRFRLGRRLELAILPLCLAGFYYFDQFVSVLAAVPPGIVVFWAVLQRDSLTAKVLSAPVLQFAGLISYSLYLVHPIAIFPYQLLGTRLAEKGYDAHQLFAAYLILAVGTTLVVSALSYHVLEVRLRHALAARLRGDRRNPRGIRRGYPAFAPPNHTDETSVK